MEVIPVFPINKTLRAVVDTYYMMSTPEAIDLSTIPNGRVDGVVTLEGVAEWYYPSRQRFEILPASVFFGLTTSTNRARIPGAMRCISIKFFPHVLALPVFQGVRLNEPVSFQSVFNDSRAEAKLIDDLLQVGDIDAQVRILEDFFLTHLVAGAQADWLQPVIEKVESLGARITVSQLAAEAGVSVKTLERRFIRSVGLTPKQYLRVVQLQHAARIIRKEGGVLSRGDLTESLGSGYYDQSHFVKACRDITGLTPKELFSGFTPSMTDLLLSNDQ
jgi:AraC-like DNA-binding protein